MSDQGPDSDLKSPRTIWMHQQFKIQRKIEKWRIIER